MSDNTNNTNTNNNDKQSRDKFKSKGLRGILVNLELDVAERFYSLAKKLGSNPTAQARGLIEEFLATHEDLEEVENTEAAE